MTTPNYERFALIFDKLIVKGGTLCWTQEEIKSLFHLSPTTFADYLRAAKRSLSKGQWQLEDLSDELVKRRVATMSVTLDRFTGLVSVACPVQGELAAIKTLAANKPYVLTFADDKGLLGVLGELAGNGCLVRPILLTLKQEEVDWLMSSFDCALDKQEDGTYLLY